MDIAIIMARAGKSLETCQKRKCAKQKLAADQQAIQVRQESNQMLQQLVNKKIDAIAFRKKAAKLKSDILKTKTTFQHLQCSLDKCNADAMALLNLFDAMLEHECQILKNKGACARLTKAKAILKKKNLNVDDYIVFMELMTSNTVNT